MDSTKEVARSKLRAELSLCKSFLEFIRSYQIESPKSMRMMDQSTIQTPKSSPSIFKDRAQEIIDLLNDLDPSTRQDIIELNQEEEPSEPMITDQLVDDEPRENTRVSTMDSVSETSPANPITIMQQEIALLKQQVDELRQSLEQCKLQCIPQQNHDEGMNESIWITKDGKRKQFTYRIKRTNGEYVKRNDMEREFRNKYMEQLPKAYFACKGTPDCDHPPLEKKGRSNKIYDHLRKNLRYAFVCIYCSLGNASNLEQFTKHLKEHFDEHGVLPDDSNLDDNSAQ